MPELVDGLDSKSSAFGHVGSSPTAPTHVMSTYNRLPLTIVKGEGCWLWDEKGDCYLDAIAGIATCTLGHSNPKLKKGLSSQLNKLQHVSNLFFIPEQEELANWLVNHSCAQSVFFCNSGAEANEAAIKLARKYGHRILGIERPIILSAESSFHGRTIGALSATGQPKYKKGFEPLLEGFAFFKYNDIKSFEELTTHIDDTSQQIAAVFLEPLQGEGGVNPGDQYFFEQVHSYCKEKKILLIFDEVQIGMGRSGNWWGYEKLKIEPDVFTVAKGLGGGHAIGALLAKEHANVFEPGDHASTFGGNPFACKAALIAAKEIEDRNLLLNVSLRGNQLRNGLLELVKKFPTHLKEVRGWGLIQAVVIQKSSSLTAQKISLTALKENLLVVSAGEKVLRIVPPLIISHIETEELITRLEKTIRSLVN